MISPPRAGTSIANPIHMHDLKLLY
jgi:hypothetical protein